MNNKARDLILTLYKEDHITKEETDLLLDAINKPEQIVTLPYQETNKQDWTWDPYRTGNPWFDVTSTT